MQKICFHNEIRKKILILQEFQKIMDLLPLKLADTTGLRYNNLSILEHIGSTFFEVKNFTANEMCVVLRKFAVSE